MLHSLLLRYLQHGAAVHFLLYKDAVFAEWGYCTQQPVFRWLITAAREWAEIRPPPVQFPVMGLIVNEDERVGMCY